jgi:hypothetical protein
MFDRSIVPVELLVDFSLPSFGGHALMEISLRVHEADPDERKPQIARLFTMVASQNAETAGVDG